MIKITIPLPPLSEQRRVVAEADRLDSFALEVTKQAESSHSRLASLRQSVLKWAFEGKLVDQDPNDEPATALLERIKADRDTAAATKPKKHRSREGSPTSS